MQQIDIVPGTALTVGTLTHAVVPGEREFQPSETVDIRSNGEAVGLAEVQTYGHNRMKDHTEINFLVVAIRAGEPTSGDLTAYDFGDEEPDERGE